MMGAQHYMSVNNQVRQSIRNSMNNNNVMINQVAKPYNESKDKIEEVNEEDKDSSEEDLNHNIKEFIERINFLLNYETLLKEKLYSSSSISSNLLELTKMREKFEKENNKIIFDLEKKAEHYKTIFKIKESLLTEIKEGSDNKNLQAKIDMLLDETVKIYQNVETGIQLSKLEKENLSLKSDLEQLMKIKNVDMIYNKQNLEILISIIIDFVESNRDLQSYICYNIEYHIKDSKVDKVLVELKQLKSCQQVFEKTINPLKNDNYLLNEENAKLRGEVVVNYKSNDLEKAYAGLKERFNQNVVELEDKAALIEDQYKNNELLKGKVKSLEDIKESNESLLAQCNDEIETIFEGNKIYENDIISKNQEILQNRKNISFSLECIESINLFFQVENTLFQKVSKSSSNLETIKAPVVRKSIIGDVFTKNTLKLKDVMEFKLEKNDSTGKDNPHQDLTNDFEKMLMTMSEIKVQNDCPFSNSFENIRKEAELTIGYLKDLNDKLSRLEFEWTEKD